ncbi:MAG: hypothetical protein H6707_07460 [Deltaproteobacteria bacterium]|nr:hypothetical protein [Deltaproteobacteria bacterium]
MGRSVICWGLVVLTVAVGCGAEQNASTETFVGKADDGHGFRASLTRAWLFTRVDQPAPAVRLRWREGACQSDLPGPSSPFALANQRVPNDPMGDRVFAVVSTAALALGAPRADDQLPPLACAELEVFRLTTADHQELRRAAPYVTGQIDAEIAQLLAQRASVPQVYACQAQILPGDFELAEQEPYRALIPCGAAGSVSLLLQR